MTSPQEKLAVVGERAERHLRRLIRHRRQILRRLKSHMPHRRERHATPANALERLRNIATGAGIKLQELARRRREIVAATRRRSLSNKIERLRHDISRL